MNKLSFILPLISAAIILILLYIVIKQSWFIYDCIQYIDALETAFPEYIDTVSGSDAYSNFYN